MVCGTEKLVKKFAKGYERGCGSAGRYIACGDMGNFIAELISEFSGICVGIRRDRGQGVFLSVLSADTRETLYSIGFRGTNARGIDRSHVNYSFTIENRDVILEFK